MSRDRSPALIALAAALPVAVIAGFVVAAVLASRDPLPARVAVAPVPAPNAGRPECTGLTTALPGPLGDFARADIAPPAPP
ncbi:MAG: DUF3515 family protein, partial [Streptomycetaceae bacterium]|nr:DUF3515 family protein [Streptomycetaceae bacterium]